MNFRKIKLGVVLFGLVLGLGVGINVNAEADELDILSIERVSVSSEGGEGDSISGIPSISYDGRYISFSSRASNLVPNDTNNMNDIFIHNRINNTTLRVSITSEGTQGNGNSGSPSISADGRYISFSSYASNLVPNDTNNASDIFVHDRIDGTTTRVSVSSEGMGSNDVSYYSSISADGRYIAFMSSASNLVPNDTNELFDVFVHDCIEGITTRVNISSEGIESNDYSYDLSMSANGRYITFGSSASNLVSENTDNMYNFFIHDRIEGTTKLINISSEGMISNDVSLITSMSANGRYISFASSVPNLVPNDTDVLSDIFVHDCIERVTTLVSISSNGEKGNSRSHYHSSISADGRYVAFRSYASNLVPNDTNNVEDIFVHDRINGTTIRVSISSEGIESNDYSYYPSISADGCYISFMSSASNLVPNDTNGVMDIFVAKNSLFDDSLLPQCSDGIDNDGDGLVDMDDSGCESAEDNDEYNVITVPTIIHDDIIVDTHWTIEHSPYLIQKAIFVKEGAILTIEPGVIVKFGGIEGNSSELILRDGGSLVARGTPSSLIYFTDYCNDEMGGDTNNDGDATSPSPNIYGSIANQGSGLLFLQYVHTKFIRSIQQDDLSKSGMGGMEIRNSLIEQCSNIYVHGDGVSAIATFDKVEVRDCSGGVNVTGVAIVNIANSLFRNISVASMSIQPHPYYSATARDIKITNSIFEGEGEYAIYYGYDGPATIDARNNWWNDPSGPSHTSNPDGQGENIFYQKLAEIDYTPWLTVRPTIDIWEEDFPQCSDGIDNDGDGRIDYPDDLGCESAEDNNEISLNQFIQRRTKLRSDVILDNNKYYIVTLDCEIDANILACKPNTGENKIYVDNNYNPIENQLILQKIGVIHQAREEISNVYNGYLMLQKNQENYRKLLEEYEKRKKFVSEIEKGIIAFKASAVLESAIKYLSVSLEIYTLQIDIFESLMVSTGSNYDESIAVLKETHTVLKQTKIDLEATAKIGKPDMVTVVNLLETVLPMIGAWMEKAIFYDPIKAAEDDLHSLTNIAIIQYQESLNIINSNNGDIQEYSVAKNLCYHAGLAEGHKEIVISLAEKIANNQSDILKSFGRDLLLGVLTSGASSLKELVKPAWQASQELDWTSNWLYEKVLLEETSVCNINYKLSIAAENTLNILGEHISNYELYLCETDAINTAHEYSNAGCSYIEDSWGFISEFITNWYPNIDPTITAIMKSPAELSIVNDQGSVTGLIDGRVVENIPYSMYLPKDEIIIILKSTEGNTIRSVGNSEGGYGLEVNKYGFDNAISFQANSIPIVDGENHFYLINWQAVSQGEKGVTMKIDEDGNGVFEKTIVSDATMESLIANAGEFYEGIEGTEITFDASLSISLGGNIVFYEWDFDGDGSYDESSTLSTITHIYGDDYSGEVILRVTDDEGLTDIDTADVNIMNVDPGIEDFGNQTIEVFDEFIYENSFTDAGWLDMHNALIKWGDGTEDNIFLTEENEAPKALGKVIGSHVYNTPGVYTAVLIIEDDDGGAGDSEFKITVEKRKTELVYTGDLNGQYSDEITLQAILTDKIGGVVGKTINFNFGGQSVSTMTNSEGIATAKITLNEIPGDCEIETSFQGDEFYLSSSNPTDFEILKEAVVITIENQEGFFDDTVILEAIILDDDGEVLCHGPYKASFTIGDHLIGQADINETGQVVIDWLVDYVPADLIEIYPIIVSFAENEYYLSGEGQSEFTLKSAKRLKQDTLAKLKTITTNNKQTQKEINKAIEDIENSLNLEFWVGASYLNEQQGHKVFDREKQAIKSLLKIIEEKGKHENPEIVDELQDVIDDLVKVDILLVKVAICDAENIKDDDTDLQEKIDSEINKAKEDLKKALQELVDNNPDKAVDSFKKAWKSTQLAINFLLDKTKLM